MKNTFKALAFAVMVPPFIAYAADKSDSKDVKTTASPPQDATTYPCWDMMQDGHMQHMHGMMNGNVQTPPAGAKAYTCWDAMQNGHMAHMRNMHMVWGGGQNTSDQKR